MTMTPRERETGEPRARRPSRGRFGRQLGVVVCLSAVGAAIVGASATGSPASRFHARPLKRDFAVLADARTADASSAELPAEPLTGAASTVFAASNSDGSRLFVSTLTDGEICLIDQEPQSAPDGSAGTVRTGLMNVGCSSPADAEQRGGVLVSPASGTLPAVAAALVPNGVASVDFVLADGTDVTVPVTNNVAWYASTQLTAVQFSVAGGGTIETGTAPADLPPISPGS
jgi:hypothetical protein